jgi:type II secretory ATPase GspE/PulE/Tfp pilus assembly ATPase PilB-like protein
MADLVRDSLRMRPDRVIVGEVRTPGEVQAYMETLLSGQARGSYATFHAQSAQEALRRLSNLGASPDDLASLDFIVLQRRIAHYDPRTKKQQELRRCLGIWMLKEAGKAASKSGALSNSSSSNLAPLCIMQYDHKSDSLKPAPGFGDGVEHLALKMGLSPSQIRSILAERSKFIRSLPQNMDASAIIDRLQKFAYK